MLTFRKVNIYRAVTIAGSKETSDAAANVVEFILERGGTYEVMQTDNGESIIVRHPGTGKSCTITEGKVYEVGQSDKAVEKKKGKITFKVFILCEPVMEGTVLAIENILDTGGAIVDMYRVMDKKTLLIMRLGDKV